MNKRITIILVLFSSIAFAQKDPSKKAQSIVEEGKLLYKSEMASWYGTDLFLENYKDRENIGGYFSYTEEDTSRCIFFSRQENPVVIGTISFDESYNTSSAKVDLNERPFTSNENDIYIIRELTLKEINSDTLFQHYKNTRLNLIPIISKKEKKVYVLTGPQNSGVVIFGNDYLLTFNKKNKLTLKKQLHKNIIPIYYGDDVNEGKEVENSMHSHLPETGDFITATDVCTLMLYGKIADWPSHHVVSEKYLNTWNCETEELTVIPMETINKIHKDQEERHGEENE